ncbi:hypothetical protein QT17_12965 [Thermus sp. 2.9]|nr:hypothetical protein QT17_12965 [Thermus sp. 2.9]
MVTAVPARQPNGHRVFPGHFLPAALAISRNTSVTPASYRVSSIVQALRGDPRAQGVLGGLALEEVSKEVGRGDEAQGVQDGGLEWRPSPPV